MVVLILGLYRVLMGVKESLVINVGLDFLVWAGLCISMVVWML